MVQFSLWRHAIDPYTLGSVCLLGLADESADLLMMPSAQPGPVTVSSNLARIGPRSTELTGMELRQDFSFTIN